MKSEPDTYWPSEEPPRVWGSLKSLMLVLIANLLSCIKLSHWGLGLMEKALECEPRQPGIRLELAKAQFLFARRQEAVNSFLEFTRLRPEDAEAYYALEEMLSLYGGYEEVRESLREIVRQKPDDFWAHMFLGLTQKGPSEIFAFLPERDEPRGEEEAVLLKNACQSFQKAIRLRPESPEAHLELGTSLERLEHYDEALEAFEKSRELEPKSIQPRLSMSLCLEKTGRVKEAIECLKETTREYPEEGLPVAYLGMVYERSGKSKEALKYYNEAVRLEPEDPVFPLLVEAASLSKSKHAKRRKRKKSR